MAKNAAGKSTSQRISDEIYATPLVQPQKIVRKVTKKAAKPAKKSVRFPLFYMYLCWKIHDFFPFIPGANLWITRRNVPDTHQKIRISFLLKWLIKTNNKRLQLINFVSSIFMTWVTIAFAPDDFCHENLLGASFLNHVVSQK